MPSKISTADLLARYNELAPKPLKAWKGKRADLEARIAGLENKASPNPAKSSDGKVVKKAAKKPVAKVAKKTNGTKLDLLSVVDIANALEMNPKVARAKLRRKDLAAKDGRWEKVKPDSTEHKAIVAALNG